MRKARKSNRRKNARWSHSALIDDSERIGKEEGTFKNWWENFSTHFRFFDWINLILFSYFIMKCFYFKFINLYKAQYLIHFLINKNPQSQSLSRGRLQWSSSRVLIWMNHSQKKRKSTNDKNLKWHPIFSNLKNSPFRRSKQSDLLLFDSFIRDFFNPLAKNGATFLRLQKICLCCF